MTGTFFVDGSTKFFMSVGAATLTVMISNFGPDDLMITDAAGNPTHTIRPGDCFLNHLTTLHLKSSGMSHGTIQGLG